MNIKLSVLDLIPTYTHQTTSQAIAATLELAQAAERLGYTRYWITEHHNSNSGAATNPAVITAFLATHTSTIRLGSGGVMLANHSPLVIAEQYALLEALNNNRIDLGIGRAPGADPATAQVLQYQEQDHTKFIHDIRLIIDTLQPEGAKITIQGEDFYVKATPNAQSSPSIWLLGSSTNSAYTAAQLGVPYAFAHHFSTNSTTEALQIYRDNFTPGYTQQPYSLITTYTVVADTQEQAEYLALSQLKNSLRIRQNLTLELLDTREESKEFPPQNQDIITDIRQKWIIADAEKAAHKIRSLAAELKLDEIMLVPTPAASQKDNPHTHPARVHSLELLAQEILT